MKGFTKLDNKFLFSNDLGVYTKLVLMGLTYFTRNGTGKCFCKKTTLGSYLNLSLYQVRCGLVELEELGVINIRRLGQGHTDIITLKDLESSSETVSTPLTIIEENKKEEELDLHNSNPVDTKEQNNTTPLQPARLDTDTTDIPDFSHHITTDPPGNHTEDTKRLHTSLRDVLRPALYQTWFSEASVVSKEPDKLIIGFPLSNNHVGWIDSHYVDLLSKVSNRSVQVVKLKGGSDGTEGEEG